VSQMFGRDHELAKATEALVLAASGTPQVLLVRGDAGIGKTTLTAAVAVEARRRGFTVLAGHCLDIDDSVALRPVREALRQVIGAVPTTSSRP
jgi:predicted ATPase